MRIESIYEGVVLAVDQLRANKFRSGLTILGVVIGVATVMGMSAMIAGIRTSIMDEMNNVGPKNFSVSRFDINDLRLVNHDGPPWGDNPRVTLDEIERLATLPLVRRVIPGLDDSGTVQATSGRPIEGVQILGRGADWQYYTSGNYVTGNNFQHADVAASTPVAVLSKPLADGLFGALDPVGRMVRLKGVPFRVVGVFEMSGNIFASIAKNWVIVPHTAALKHLGTWDGLLGALVVTAPEATQADAMDQVITTMRVIRGLRPAEPNNFAVVRQQEMLDTFNRITAVFFIVMIALSSVGLLVGGVGVIAIMMIAVTERTREIGIRKALGATRSEILWQFLVEAATLTVAGAAIGMAIGGAGAFLIANATPIPAAVPVGAVVAALAMAAVAGILFGIWPAWRASRMDPVVALRYE